MLLAIDTSTGTSVAVVDRAGTRAERTSADTRGH
ncbi:tRNA (adenosine(37)-N6)-threonylcarbamoyltransferase complex dimerization subunit type 1 TsaB, partial [Schumannella luteola]